MSQVAEKFRQEEVGVPEILSVTRALTKGVHSLRSYTGKSNSREVGTAVLGTVKGDMHDIGKNLVKMMMESRNIHVVDLGVDVSPRKFLDEALASKAQIVCMSGIMESSERDMRAVIEEFEDRGIRGRVYIMVGENALTTTQRSVLSGGELYLRDDLPTVYDINTDRMIPCQVLLSQE